MATRREQEPQPTIHPEYQRRPAEGPGARRWRADAIADTGFDPCFPLVLAAMRDAAGETIAPRLPDVVSV